MRARVLRFGAPVAAIAVVIATYRAAIPVNATTVALSLLLIVLGVSALWGLAEATLASVVAVLGFNYYFLPPVGTFTIQDPENWVALAVFLVTAVTASQLAERARRRAAEAEARRLDIERLYTLSQAMIVSGNARQTIREFVQTVTKVLGCEGAAFYYRPGEEFFRSGREMDAVTDHDLMAAAEVEGLSVTAGRATAPVRLGGRTLGSMALAGVVPSEQVLRAIVNLAAITVEKARALEDASRADAARQSEALKSAMVDSLAHDIKTPLTSIKAAVTSLLSTGGGAADRELLTIIDEEADRLNRLAAEVTAMARVEAGKLHLDKRAAGAAGLIERALEDFGGRAVTVAIAEGVADVECDAELVQQVIGQLVENALKYAGEPVKVTAERRGTKVVIGVADAGPGIEEDERVRIFDKFFRGRRHRFDTKGTGMGLAIAKGILEAHGEKIWVESEAGQGAIFYFSLPTAGGGQ